MASLKSLEPKYVSRRRLFATQYKEVLAGRPHGYNPQVILDGKGNDKYICSDCGYILRQPLQSFCGHRFCAECFDYILRSAGSEPVKCKLCVQEGTETEFSFLKRDQTFPDNGVRRELELLKAACFNPGCNWNGSFKEYQNHEQVCAHKRDQCPQCGNYFKQEEIVNHKANDCPMLPDRCPYCHATMTKRELMFHDCENLVIECAGCKRKMTKNEMLRHSDPADKICPSPSVPCLFGCKEVVPVSELKTHLTQELDVHISEMERRILDLEHQLKNRKQEETVAPSAGAMAVAASVTNNTSLTSKLRPEIDEIKRHLIEVSEQIASNGARQSHATHDTSGDKQAQIELLDRKILIFERVSAVFKREIDKCGKQIDDLLKDNRDNKDRLDVLVRQVKTIEEQGKTNKNQVESINKSIQTLETTSYDGTLVWKIDNFFVRRQKAVHGQETSFYSQPFYTSRTGYKACARVYLNGDGMGKDTHVSLFFVLMRGEYDALLPWPFQQKVTMTWIDQNRKSDVVDTFRPDPTSSSFKRPTSTMNIASGCPLFMKHSLLDDAAHGYVKDNVAFVKITIDTTNLNATG